MRLVLQLFFKFEWVAATARKAKRSFWRWTSSPLLNSSSIRARAPTRPTLEPLYHSLFSYFSLWSSSISASRPSTERKSRAPPRPSPVSGLHSTRIRVVLPLCLEWASKESTLWTSRDYLISSWAERYIRIVLRFPRKGCLWSPAWLNSGKTLAVNWRTHFLDLISSRDYALPKTIILPSKVNTHHKNFNSPK